LPDYLDRPQVVTRSSKNELHIAEFAVWAEPLENNFRRVLAENLALLLPTERLLTYPWDANTTLDYQIVIDVSRFDAELSGSAVLVVRWSILGENGRKVYIARESTLRKVLAVNSYEALASAESSLLATFSQEIVKTLVSIGEKRSPGSE
ncbi:MAG: membrane integrity-associated transporter subunit PqiC, partial [Deltaproteobacteria bacterium]|nr:membrane integrity-associated transporter subunit PqiC [Deltaproteobacteria bacterium]